MAGSVAKRVGIGAGVLVVLAIAAAASVYFFFPTVLLDSVRAGYEREAGVVAKSVMVDGYEVPYYEGGNGETLVLVHGFGDSKMSFVQSAKWLTPKYHVILPEVPGFGETAHAENRKYGIRSQVDTLHAAFKAMGLDKFHLGGNSMGGHIAAAYALCYPADVKSLILIDAAGIKVSDGEPYADSTEPVRTVEDFDAYLAKVFVNKPPIPGPIKAHLVARAAESFEWQNRIRRDIRSDTSYLLNDTAKNITAPTLVLWGDTDRLVSLDVGKAYNEAIAGSKLVVFPNCGHSPQYEVPQKTAETILDFLSSAA